MARLPAGLEQRGDTYLVRHKGPDGNWTRTSVGTDREQALLEHARLRGPKGPAAGPGVTMASVVQRWLAHQRARSKPRTLEGACNRSGRLLQFLGPETRVQNLTGAQLNRFIAIRRQQGVSAATINGDLRILKAILRHALSEKRIPELPVKITLLAAPRKKAVNLVSSDELHWVLEAAEPRVRALLAICATTGLRLQEALHLQWTDIDLAGGGIQVRPKTYLFRRADGQVEEQHWSPKSHQARGVAITSDTVDELRRYRMQQRYSTDTDWVFQSERRLRQRWSSPFKRIRKAFHLASAYERGRGTHAIRHSVASEMLGNGIDIETVRQILGHSSVLVTQGYLHSNDERKQAAARAGSLLRPKKRRR